MAKRQDTYQFSAISIKDKVAVRFRIFSKRIAKSHSETLTVMIDFFEWHGLDPSKKFGKSVIQEILRNRERTETSIKRNEATIAIIRNIEINQTKPSNAMLLSLFGESLKEQQPIKAERKLLEKPKPPQKETELTVPRIRYDNLQGDLNKMKGHFGYVLDKVSLVKSSFGKDYLRLDISKGELENYKRKVHND